MSVQVEADCPEEGALKRGDARGCQDLHAENSDARFLDGREARLRDLTLVWHHTYPDLLVVRGRGKEGMKRMYGVKFLPILMSSTRTAQMVMLWAHEQDHAGVEYTYATSMQVAWIVGGRTLAKKIKNLCMRCRFLRKQLEGQKISILPPGIPVPEDHPDRCAEAGADCTSGGARGD